MRSWNNVHKPRLQSILEKIDDWGADYIVPVGRKSAKLFRTLGEMDPISVQRVFYKEYFKFCNVPLLNKKVAVVDDAARTCSTLADYRQYFEEQKAIVRTFAIVGHREMTQSGPVCYDPLAEIEEYVTEPGYDDFLLSEAEYLNKVGFYHDINHLMLELSIPQLPSGLEITLKDLMNNHGYVYSVQPYDGLFEKWSVIDPDFAESKLLKTSSGIVKLRFQGYRGTITCVPMIFPELRISDECQISRLKTPFELPCQMIRKNEKHSMDELCYWSISLLLSAELGRMFVKFLKEHYGSSPALILNLQKINVRNIDFDRYFGISKGDRLQRGIKQFLLREDYEADEDLARYLSSVMIPRQLDFLSGEFSGESITKLVDHLRNGYEKAVKEAGTHRGVYYSLPLNKMKEVCGASTLFLMESLDFLCDLGTFVPITNVNHDLIQRTYRTGEVKEDTSFKRTQILIPLAINVIAEENDITDRKVGSVLLTKILANFAYDFPSSPALLDRLHRFVRVPDTYGTNTLVFHPFRTAHLIPLSKPESLGNLYTREIEEPVKGDPQRRFRRVWYRAKPDALKEIDKYFDNTQQIQLDEIVTYISFLAKLYQKTGSVNVLTALSVCRTPDVLYRHIYENVNRWVASFSEFLETFVMPNKEHHRKGSLRRSGANARAGLTKIDLWNSFNQIVKDMNDKMTETRFRTSLRKVSTNIDDRKELPILDQLNRVLSIQRALTGIALAKLFPAKRRSPEDVFRWANVEFQRYHFDFDIRAFENETDQAKISEILQSAHFTVWYMVDNILPKPKGENELERNRVTYLELAQNRAVQCCVMSGWNMPSFVHWDLTGSRKSTDVLRRIASMYEETDKGKSQFGGKCITVNPGGNDCLLFVYGMPIVALKAAAFSMQKLTESGNLVKGGIAYANYQPGEDYSGLMAAMGHAKDLCELKKEGYRNLSDLLVSTPFVEAVEKDGIGRKYFTPLQITDLETRVGNANTKVQIFRLELARFVKDNMLIS
jgi:hypothetical protein